MLFSELEERGRHFKLALRATIPLLMLTSLVFYSTYLKGGIDLRFENNVLIAAIVFISVYFIYFFIKRSVEESLIDPATQGFTEKAFIDTLKKRHPQALVLITIDNLYLINQNYSIQQVDMMLYNFVHKLNYYLKQENIKNVPIGRRYGAEFLVGLNTDKKSVEHLIESFIVKYNTIDNIEIDFHYAVITDIDHNIEKSIEQLRNMLQLNTDRNEQKKLIKDAKELSNTEQRVINAMKKGNLSLSFRPLLNVHTNTIDIYEIAVKLKHPTQGDILPRVFLPIINRTGMGREYDLMLVKHLVNLLPLIDENISLTFNLSPFSLRDRYFQEQFFKLLDNTDIDASRLIIQLYERKTHHNLSGYLRTLKQVRSNGIRICIDNFGSSNASMEYMKHFKFDMIQFDRNYVTKLKDKTTFAMLESLIHMSKDLGIITVAKWVDKEEQKQTLKHLGIDYLQGFGISKPINEYELIEKYNKGN